MGRAPCCDKANVKKGPWSPEEDAKLNEYMEKYGTGGNWIALPQKAGLKRCGKSCRLRWLNYLRPNIKHGDFTEEEDRIICSLFASIGSRWSIIAAQLPGRTDNDIKNYWNTKLKKKLMAMAPHQSQRKPPAFSSSHQTPTTLLPSHSLSLLFNDLIDGTNCSYYPSAKAFAGFDPIPAISSNILGNRSGTILATDSTNLLLTEEGLVNPRVQCYQPLKESNLLSFGSDASCSSNSEGSFSQISYGFREIKQEDMGFRSYISSGYYEENQKFMINYGNNGGEAPNQQWAAEKPNGYFGETPVDWGLEDVSKQLISSNSGGAVNGCNSNNFLIDENKTQEKVMAMYAYY